ncbi:hypothetical protein ILUMI_13612 [Ignelater luminosus]|uniref:Uncharacterized protein n=1 Tax=Ignelater luminosus TaxID=2038154 RepID=A0A8K0CY66_IGNLU|nr:hypothetical protein ILUMI_13612 [Ignelater luminosus]
MTRLKIQNDAKVAELKLMAFVVYHNIPFLVMDHLADLIRSACSDSKIAQEIKCSRTKAAAISRAHLNKRTKDHQNYISEETDENLDELNLDTLFYINEHENNLIPFVHTLIVNDVKLNMQIDTGRNVDLNEGEKVYVEEKSRNEKLWTPGIIKNQASSSTFIVDTPKGLQHKHTQHLKPIRLSSYFNKWGNDQNISFDVDRCNVPCIDNDTNNLISPIKVETAKLDILFPSQIKVCNLFKPLKQSSSKLLNLLASRFKYVRDARSLNTVELKFVKEFRVESACLSD